MQIRMNPISDELFYLHFLSFNHQNQKQITKEISKSLILELSTFKIDVLFVLHKLSLFRLPFNFNFSL